MLRVVVPKESAAGEARVALVPESVKKLVEAGLEVVVESGAGAVAGFLDEHYESEGARVAADAKAAYEGAGMVLRVQPPQREEVERIPEGAALLGMLAPGADPEIFDLLAERKITAFSMELIPRITRAQKMDALSSQATVAGYRAALIAATKLGRFFPMLMTAAGTVAPAKVLIVGVGVAGLQAIATARRLGAMVQAFDIRPAVKEEVESLGASFVGLTLDEAEDEGGYAREVSEDVHRQEQELLAGLIAEADAVITAAQVPGKKAPVLVTEQMVAGMKAGSVVVDLAAETGGNCEVTKAGEDVLLGGVTVVGVTNAASGLPFHASQMYSRNITNLVQHLLSDGALQVDLDDEITSGCCVTEGGKVRYGA